MSTTQTEFSGVIIDAATSRQVQVKMLMGFLDLIIMQLLRAEPTHGYRVITKFRKTFGVYFGPSTIYPQLLMLERKGYVKSEWLMNEHPQRPIKRYTLTTAGLNLLNFSEDTLTTINRKLGIEQGKMKP